MFRKILVPLDGSDLAERALDSAFALARQFGSEVILLRAIVPDDILVSLPALIPPAAALHPAKPPYHSEEAEAYLFGVKVRWSASGVRIRTEVLAGTPPEVIVAFAREQLVDLIVMSTHGRSGFSRLIYGSVAEAVLRGAHLPILLTPIPA
jgi:nucleotide-binding universal stress UspA family protein